MEFTSVALLLVSEIGGEVSRREIPAHLAFSKDGFILKYDEPEMPGVLSTVEGGKEKLVLRRSDGTHLRFLKGEETVCRYVAGPLSGTVNVRTTGFHFSSLPFSFEIVYTLDGTPCRVSGSTV